MKLSPEKQKNLILTIMVVAIAIGSLWWFLIHGLEKMGKTNAQNLKKLKEKVDNQQKEIDKEIADRNASESYKTFIAQQEQQMPTNNTETWLFKEISVLAERHKLSVVNTALESFPDLSDFKFKGQPYKLAGFKFSFKGELNQIGSFLRDLENNKPLAEVYEITITAGSDVAPHIHTVDVRISMVTKL